MNESGHLLHNLLLFGRLLRGLGLDVNPGRVMDLAQAIGHIEIGRRSDFYHAARTLLVHKREDLPLFDEAFELFWRRPGEAGVTIALGQLLQRRSNRPIITPPPLKENPPAPDSGSDVPADQPPIIEVTQTVSDREVLRQKNFAEMTPEELAAVKRLMTTLVWHLGERRTRRREPGHGPLFDLRRTVRRNLKYGGEVLEWAKREPKYKPRPLVILADVSGSMERVSRLFLHFLYAVTASLSQPVETFVFSTRLTRITRQLRNKDVDQALRDVARAVHDWSSGTKMGDALKTFNYDWGRRVLGHGAVVLLISDGWDCGDVALLKKEIERLHLNCHRLIWLNPLLGLPQFEPLTRGTQAALPHVDDFLPMHNLASLEELADHLAHLKPR